MFGLGNANAPRARQAANAIGEGSAAPCASGTKISRKPLAPAAQRRPKSGPARRVFTRSQVA